MFVRIVKMSFHKEKVEDFLKHFHANKTEIRNFKGCLLLELYQDKQQENQFFT